MFVIFNSDVLYTNVFVHGRLHRHWQQFVDGCRSVKADLVFPRTALYEIELRQQELYAQEMSEIEKAAALLRKYGAEIAPQDPRALIGQSNLLELFAASGVNVRVEEATLDDFRDAERRAALHLPPGSPRERGADGKALDQSDEMRDLLIWATARRLAQMSGGAILLSRDRVHTGKLAREEAEALGLLIALDFEEALGRLGVETEAGKIASKFLKEAWLQLVQAGLPLRQEFTVSSITAPSFVQGKEGLDTARFSFSTPMSDGKTFSSNVAVFEIKPTGFRMTTSGTKINKGYYAKGDLDIAVGRQAPVEASDFEQRLHDLRELLR